MKIKKCKISGVEFKITDQDLEFYKANGVPEPENCPEERARLRMMFGNQRNLFSRNCSATQKKIISYYPPDSINPVYDLPFWWSDSWDQFANGFKYDPNQNFFEQFGKLMKSCPRPAMHRAYLLDENSDYTNYAGQNKNCYLIFDSDLNRDCMFGYSLNSCVDCLDCLRTEKCELCYECVDSVNCYSSIYLQNCENCSTSSFLKNCIGCSDCFGCINLRNKKYFFFNQQLTETEYKARLASFKLSSRKNLNLIANKFFEFCKTFPFAATEGVNNEDCFGNYLNNCKNAYECFDSRELWDCSYIQQAFGDCKNSMDCTEVGQSAEFLYETAYAGLPANNMKFTSHVFPNANNLTYCYFTPSCSECFACVGLHHKKFCIFNQQYSEQEYHQKVKEIIANMKLRGEWGQVFPPELSPFEYNISCAQDYLPLTEEEALARGYRWRDSEKKEYQKVDYKLPDELSEINDTILNQTLACSVSGRNYKIQKMELIFYKKLNLPLPDLHEEQRFLKRLAKRQKRKLYQTKCAVSGKEIWTAHDLSLGLKIVDRDIFSGLCN